MKQFSKWIFYLAVLPIALGFCGWQGWAVWNWLISPRFNPTNAGEVQLNIAPGTSTAQIGRDLEALGLIRSSLAWNVWASWLKLHDRAGAFKAGTYKIETDGALPLIADRLWQGQIMRLSFTIPEGWNRWQMAKYFESLGYFSEEEFITAIANVSSERYGWLPQNLPFVEGYLFPDTYELASDRITPEQVIDLMLSRFESTALPLYNQAQDQTPLSLNDWVTLASIVEKEAAIATERPLIAGVFSGRLADKMKLEADPTVEYALGIRQTADQPLTLKQVQIDSPYNTYRYPGLPPTAIASPGLDSLKATLAPQTTDYRYFVARYDGTHLFTKTLKEHEAAVKAVRQQREALQNKS
ncbi:MAG: endolytic transglycosylase MltG [Jaaginema sp. PMC 1079.18]|nr:endolytic transglycosylase MltG [Jaaginema sp. PMC 1079.18]MEC4867955.1 endolytic transglycosylase MltG [Jaaginema sp. PMC 1078.18]